MNEQVTMMNQQQQQQQQQQLMTMTQMNTHQPPQMVPMNMSYGMWPQQQHQFLNLNPNLNPNSGLIKPAFNNKSLGPRSNWKGKKVSNGNQRKEQKKSGMMSGSSSGGGGVVNPSFGNYNPSGVLNELQNQNRLKTCNFFPKKKFNKNNSNMNVNMNTGSNFNNYKNNMCVPYAPRNTSSFLIRAKKSGGIASFISPSPVTPAVLPTPIFSPAKEVLMDMAKEEWGLDGYGSMKGLIRLRSPGNEVEDEDEDEGGSSGSDLEEHVEVERRLDHDLSRFEMIYDPNSGSAGGVEYHNVLENRVDDQDSHIAQLEEENLILKERLFLMERDLGDLRRRMQCLEGRESRGVSENDSEEAHSMEDNNGDYSEDIVQGDGSVSSKGKVVDSANKDEDIGTEAVAEKKSVLDVEGKVDINDNVLVNADKNFNITNFEGKEENDAGHYSVSIDNLDRKNSNDNNLILHPEAKTVCNVNQSSEFVMIGDVCMNEVGVAVDNMVPDKEVIN